MKKVNKRNGSFSQSRVIIFTIRRKLLMMFSVSLNLLFLVITTTALTGGERSPSYLSVRTLDHYGNAIQLGHAQEAAKRYGRPVVVAVVDRYEKDDADNTSTNRQEDEDEYSLPKDVKGKQSPSSFVMVVSVGKSPILHPIQLPLEESDKNSSSLIAMCFTGVKGDANWLLRKFQEFAADVWERYDTTTMSVPIVAHNVARILGKFFQKPEREEWQSALGLPGKHDSEDDNHSSWSRPLGVQTIILSSLDCQQRQGEPRLLIVEPSGRILNPTARTKSGNVSLGAIGKGSNKIEKKLLRQLKAKSECGFAKMDKDQPSSSSWEDNPPTYNECRDAIIRVLLEESSTNIAKDNGSYEHNRAVEIMVESYSSDLGKIERIVSKH